jgi:hypothetical protein
MMGGYTAQDRNPQGSLGDGDVYRIYHWHLIDSFIYFSHNLVSIPTPGWTNTAHRNGVKVLGTFITEWEAGAEACVLIFASMSTAEAFAKKLVEIAQCVAPPLQFPFGQLLHCTYPARTCSSVSYICLICTHTRTQVLWV